LKFKHYLFHCASEGKVIALYTTPWRVRIVVQNYMDTPQGGYRQHEVLHANFNKWLADAMGDAITGTNTEQLAAVVASLKKPEDEAK